VPTRREFALFDWKVLLLALLNCKLFWLLACMLFMLLDCKLFWLLACMLLMLLDCTPFVLLDCKLFMLLDCRLLPLAALDRALAAALPPWTRLVAPSRPEHGSRCATTSSKHSIKTLRNELTRCEVWLLK